MKRFAQLVCTAALSALFLVLGHQAVHAAGSGTISGLVTSDGSPVQSGWVSVYTFQSGDSAGYSSLASDGSYSVSGLAPGQYRVQFGGSGFPGEYWHNKPTSSAADPVTVNDGQTTTGINADLDPPATITGVVRDANGQPLAGANVSLRDGGYGGSSTTTNNQGQYSFTGLRAANSYIVQFSPPAGTPWLGEYWEDRASEQTATPIAVDPGETFTADATLAKGAQIRGTVTEDGGTPLSGIDVVVVPGGGGAPLSTVTTSEDGTYASAGLPPGVYKAVFSLNYYMLDDKYIEQWWDGAPSSVTADLISVTGSADVTGIDAAMQQGGVITGTVRDADGDPLSNISVSASPGVGGSSSRTTSTDANGTYTLRGLNTSNYKVRFQGNGTLAPQWYNAATSEEAGAWVSVTAGQTTGGIDARMWQGATISGRVTNPQGDPVAGVTVGTEPYTTFATTGQDGTYSVQGLAEGSYKVRFLPPSGTSWMQGYWNGKQDAGSADPVVVTRGQQRGGIDISLVRGGSISGRVTGSGSPLGQVSVSVRTSNYGNYFSTMTSGDGTWQAAGLPPGQYVVEFLPYGSNHVPEYYEDKSSSSEATLVPLALGQDVTGIDADLTPGAAITGRVTDPQGAPVGGTAVSVDGPSYGYATTRADGTYTIERLRAGSYLVKFSGQGDLLDQYYNGKGEQQQSDPVTLSTGEQRSGIDAQLARGKRIVGTVTDAEGAPVPLVSVRIYRQYQQWSPVASVVTGVAGTYATNGLPPGKYKVEFAPSGNNDYLNVWNAGKDTFDLADPVTVTDASGATVDAVLQRGGSIAGIVTDPDGVALQANVTVHRNGQYASSAFTGQDGRYTLPRLKPGDYKLWVQPWPNSDLLSEWYDKAESVADATPITVTAGGTRTLDVQLARAAKISGTVRGPGGTPVAGVRVRTYGGPGYATTTTAADGTYTLARLRPGSYQVKFGAKDGLAKQWYDRADLRAQAQTIQLVAGQDRTGVDAKLRSVQGISGTVRDPEGTPVASVRVAVYPKGQNVYADYTYTDSNGRFFTHDLPAGDYDVQLRPAANSGLATQWFDGARVRGDAKPVTVSTGLTDVTAELARGATISGRVTDAQGDPVPGVQVSAEMRDEYRYAQTDSNGDYRIQGLASGKFRVQFDAYATDNFLSEWYDNAAGPDVATPVPVTPGSSVTGVDAVLAEGGTVSGTVTNPDGSPATYAYIQLYAGDEVAVQGYADQLGRYSVTKVRTATYTVATSGGQGLQTWAPSATTISEATPFQVTGGSTVTGKDIRIQRGGSISGTVTAEGVPNPAGQLVLTRVVNGQDEGSRFGAYWSNGAFKINSVAPGTYRLHAIPEGTAWAQQWYDGADSPVESDLISVGENQDVSGISFSLKRSGTVSGVVSNSNGVSVPARVGIYRPGSEDYERAVITDDAGHYAVVGLPPGAYQVRFKPLTDGYATQWWDGAQRRGEADLLTVSSGGTATADAVVVAGGTISGTVADPDGKPVGGAKVSAFGDDGSYAFALSGADGRYTMTGVDADTYRIQARPGSSRLDLVRTWQVSALTPGDATPVEVGNGDSVTADVELQEGARISGRVWDTDGKPVKGIGVDVFDENGRKSLTAWTDELGRYTTTGLLPGKYLVRFMPGYYGGEGLAEQWWNDEPTMAQADPITLAAKQKRTDVDAVLRQIGAGDTAPGAPHSFTAAAGDGKVTLQWQAPWNNGGLPITYYKVTGTPRGECETLGARECTINGLANGTTYSFTVQARNSVGLSPASETVTAVPFGKPAKPTKVTAVGGQEQATVSWSGGDANGRPITSYTVTATPGDRSCSTAGLRCDVTGLAAGTSYTFTVVARNEAGTSSPSEPSNAVTPTGAGGGGGGVTPQPQPQPPAPPSAPASLKSKVKKRVMTVTWTPVPNATSYQVRFGKKGKWKTVTTPKFKSSKLKKGKYVVEVKAVGPGGTSGVEKTTVRVR